MRLHFLSYRITFPIQPLLWLWLAVSIFLGCSRLRVDDPIVPKTPLPKFELVTDSTGTATVNLDSLAGGRLFTITFDSLRPFKHGRMELAAGSSKLRYTATDTSRSWAADSGFYTFCQASQCRDGQIKVRNIRYKKDKDTVIVEPGPDTCVTLPLRSFNIVEAETRRISLAFSEGDTGTLVVRNMAFTIRQIGDRSSTLFDYIASGGPQNYYSGFDEITYSGTVQGRRVCGMIEVVVGDSCQPRARPDVITRSQSGATTILPAALLGNDLGCAGQRASYNLRLRPSIYLGTLQIPTQFGTITDTTIGGTQAFIYRRNDTASTKVDSFFYYTQNRDTDLVTRAKVRLP